MPVTQVTTKVIKDKGKQDLKNLQIRLSKGLVLDVGIDAQDGAKQHPSRRGLTIAEVGAIHELGLAEPRIPQRSFLASWFANNQTSILLQLRAAGRNAFIKRTPLKKAGQRLGDQFVRQIQAQFGAIPPPNAPRTIERKGHGMTLIETEALREAISATVKVKRGRIS